MIVKSGLPLSKIAAILFITITAVSNIYSEIIGDFKKDFKLTSPNGAWNYKWNPDGVSIGDYDNYVDLLKLNFGSKLVIDPEQKPGKKNTNLNARRLKVGQGEVTTGISAQKARDGIDHCAIVTFTIQEGQAGTVSILDSHVNCLGKDGSGKISIHVNDQIIGSDDIVGDEPSSFNVPLGNLKAGDVIYFTFAPPNEKLAVNLDLQFKIDLKR